MNEKKRPRFRGRFLFRFLLRAAANALNNPVAMPEAFHNHSVTAATILRISQVPPMTVPVTIAADADVNTTPVTTFAAAFTVFTATFTTFAPLCTPLTFAVVAGLSGRLG